MQVFLNIVNKFFDPIIHMGSGVGDANCHDRFSHDIWSEVF